ncbi:hypothetical protein J5N97_027765 [Dioscorea zingiberensis]|uniref:NAD(P)-binding domain-containing protein n=1 Tax=Dioscorea zingiberensis TaxID=325984 RepID=A0A9D5H469_9LILI|nr:hypothetical protein J5N97_027765 [Dioscorea zingiberensis]
MAVSFLRVPLPPHTALKTLATNLFISSISASQMDSASTSAEKVGASSAEGKKKVFVAGSTGRTGKKIVEQLLAKGFAVRAGALDLEKARSSLPQDSSLDIVKANVTEGSEKLAEAIGDAEAVICATGFRYSWDVFAPWKVDNFGTVNLVEACRKIGVKGSSL